MARRQRRHLAVLDQRLTGPVDAGQFHLGHGAVSKNRLTRSRLGHERLVGLPLSAEERSMIIDGLEINNSLKVLP